MRLLLCVSLCACLSGCIGKIGESNKPPIPQPIIIRQPTPSPIPPATQVESTVNVGMPSSLLKLLCDYAGKSNTITLSEPMTIAVDDSTLDLKAGAGFSYKLSPERGEFVFNDPKPILTIREFGLKIRPYLTKIVIHPDDTAVATGRWMGFEKEKKFDLKDGKAKSSPDETGQPIEAMQEPLPSPSEFLESIEKPTPVAPRKHRPEVWMFSDGGDLSSQAFNEFLERDEELPFILVVHRDVPDWLKATVKSFPFFYFPVDKDFVDEAKSFRMIEKYESVDQIIKVWKHERQNVKKPKVAATPKRKTGVRSWANISRNGPQWTENHTGRTSPRHLIEDHKVDPDLVNKYRHDQVMLNRIHSRAHGDR